jgi:hypothetical protein
MELSARSYQEKRNFIRMRIDSPAALVAGERAINGICINLSGGGMLVALEEPLDSGQECEITISSAFGHSPMLRAKTRVNRVMSEGGQVLLGLEIAELLNA